MTAQEDTGVTFVNAWSVDLRTGAVDTSSTTSRTIHADAASNNVMNAQGCLVSPGLVDVHINGAFHVDFSHPQEDAETYVAGLRTVAARLPRTGVVAFLPTLFSSSATTYRTLLPLLAQTAREGVQGARILGWHAEGPFMQTERRGAHSIHVIQSALENLDVNDKHAVWQRVQDVYGADNLRPSNSQGTASEVVRMITLAPEVFSDTVAAFVISTLVERGVTVAIGHSSCTSEQMSNAMAAGATLVTHLFNAMPGLHHREPGIVGTALHNVNARLKYTLIADGVHVVDAALAIAFCASPDRCVLITDALPLLHDSASEPADGTYEWKGGGNAQQLRKHGQRLYLASTADTLAGR